MTINAVCTDIVHFNIVSFYFPFLRTLPPNPLVFAAPCCRGDRRSIPTQGSSWVCPNTTATRPASCTPPRPRWNPNCKPPRNTRNTRNRRLRDRLRDGDRDRLRDGERGAAAEPHLGVPERVVQIERDQLGQSPPRSPGDRRGHRGRSFWRVSGVEGARERTQGRKDARTQWTQWTQWTRRL